MGFLDGALGAISSVFSNIDSINKLPKKKLLSSRAVISFQTPDGEKIDLAEVHSFKHSTVYKVVKEWKPYGSNRTKKITEVQGYNLSFSGTKTDWLLNFFMYMNEVALMGETDAWSPTIDNSVIGQESIGNQILFDVSVKMVYDDGSFEEYRYYDVNILNYDFEVPPDNSEIPETFTAFSPERKLVDESTFNSQETIKLTSVIASIIKETNRVNKI